MPKHIACGDVVEGCAWTAQAPSDDELIRKVAEHAKASHGVHEVTPELATRVKEAIRSR